MRPPDDVMDIILSGRCTDCDRNPAWCYEARYCAMNDVEEDCDD